MRLLLQIIAVSLLTIGCNKKTDIKDSNVLVKVGNKVLYRSIMEESLPAGLSAEDSIIAAESFIRSWINDILLYNIAVKNLNDKDNIDRLVENYRKSLLIYQYEEQLINERLNSEIDERSMTEYYNLNKDKFKLEQPLVKGFFLKVPANAPQMSDIRNLYKSTAAESLEKLERFSLNNAVVFNYFIDKWVDFDELIEVFPKDQLRKEDLTVQKKTMEKEIDNFFYFLNITDYLLPGDNAPYEHAKSTVRKILINQRKIDFLKNTEDELYQRALNRGEIQFYGE